MNQLILSAYVPLALRTEKPLPPFDRLVHSCMGLITEIGEVTTELKRMAIYEKPLDDFRKAHILEEIGDVMWYIAIAIDVLEMNVDFLETAPRMVPPTHTNGAWEATALMLGDHCGRICEFAQKVGAFEITKSDSEVLYRETYASIGLIVNGMCVLAKLCDSSLEVAMFENIAKLRLRYPDVYSNEAAEGRADKAGADARAS
jgi:NTP pyrophosphatase (non-canonical NTP hydrolase)